MQMHGGNFVSPVVCLWWFAVILIEDYVANALTIKTHRNDTVTETICANLETIFLFCLFVRIVKKICLYTFNKYYYTPDNTHTQFSIDVNDDGYDDVCVWCLNNWLTTVATIEYTQC